MHVSNDKYVPKRKHVTDLDQGLNIASYSTSSVVPITPWKVILKQSQKLVLVVPPM